MHSVDTIFNIYAAKLPDDRLRHSHTLRCRTLTYVKESKFDVRPVDVRCVSGPFVYCTKTVAGAERQNCFSIAMLTLLCSSPNQNSWRCHWH